jgi:prophage regulatory protein
MGKRLIPYEDLKSRGIPYSKSHLWRLEKARKFPKRVYMGGGGKGRGRTAFAYDEAEIDAHIEGLLAARAENGEPTSSSYSCSAVSRAIHWCPCVAGLVVPSWVAAVPAISFLSVSSMSPTGLTPLRVSSSARFAACLLIWFDRKRAFATL